MKTNTTLWGYGAGIAATVAATLLGWLITPRFDLVNVAMVYLLAVVVVAYRFTRGAAMFASLLGVAAFDVLFVPPQGAFSVNDLQYLLTFAIMLLVGVLVAGLMDRLRRQAAARAALEIASETEHIRAALLASISHDLRTPLAVMTGASSALATQGTRMSAEEREVLARSVYDQARGMSERVSNVLQMARLETGTMQLDADWIDMSEIVGAVLQRLQSRLAGHPVLLDLPEDLPLVQANAGLIDQLLGNLLENVALHTPAHTTVRVRAVVDGDTMTVSVEDYGPGLPPGDTEKLFAKFSHGTQGTTGTGMGLGLAICRAIARLHGGALRAEALPAGGTAMRFTLNVSPAPQPPRDAAP